MPTKSRDPIASLRSAAMDESGGGQSDFEPPPSTMAAQLISNISAINKPSPQASQKDNLKALMLEVSSTENSAQAFTDLQAKLQHKHKLIYVFARSVLERLASDDPFMDIKMVVSQAFEALDVFIGIVKEVPDVLAFRLGGDEGRMIEGRGCEPLWIWLFPRILALLGRDKCDGLTEKIKDIFYVSFQAVSSSPKLWNLTSFFFCYLRECAAAMLGHFQNSNLASYGKMVNITLPYDTIDTSMFSQEREDDTMRDSIPNCTYVIKDAASGIWHATNVLSMLVDISMASASSHDATPAFQDYLVWILESFLMIHDIQTKWKSNSTFQESCKKSKILCFCATHALLTSLRNFLSESMLRKGYALVSLLCASLLERPTDLIEKSNQLSLCSSILNLVTVCNEHESMRKLLALHLIPAVKYAMSDEESCLILGKDFQTVGWSLCHACEVESSQPYDSATQSFDSIELGGEFERLGLEYAAAQSIDQRPPSKRRKVHNDSDLLEQITSRLYMLLGAQSDTDLAGLPQVTDTCFTELSDVDRCKAIEYLAMIPCAANDSLEVKITDDGSIEYSTCFMCEGSQPPGSFTLDTNRCDSIRQDAIMVLEKVVTSHAFQTCRKPRVLAMIALKRFTVHFRSSEFLSLDPDPSELGKWCLSALTSSTRELRIAAGRTLPGFLCGSGLSKEKMHSNRLFALSLLRQISSDALHMQETCILAWGQVGRTLNDDELNLVLHKLVEYLSHTNRVVSAAAFNEILTLANTSDMTIERMFSPFWDTIAIVAVRDLLSKPQAAQLIADLLGKTVQYFLVLTQSSTLPYLVATGEVRIIKRIAQAQAHMRREEAENQEKNSKQDLNYNESATKAKRDEDDRPICMETTNHTHILAYLLSQPNKDMEDYILTKMRATSSHLENMEMAEIMRSEPASVALHLLKMIGDADDDKKTRIRHGLDILAKWAPSHDASLPTTIGPFLGQHTLGIVARLSQAITGTEQTISEKRRCVKAIEEMVRLGKNNIRTARPQICACIQSALAQTEIQAAGLSAWSAMLHNLLDDDIELMIESTFSTIIQRWHSFDQATRDVAQRTLQFLLEKKVRLIRNTIVNLPSLAQFPQLSDIEKKLNGLRKSTGPSNAFEIFSRRVSHENSSVVLQALVELKSYLKIHQSFLQASAVSEQPDPVVGSLIRAILDACMKFSQSNVEIAQLSGECVGLMGCLDPNRVEAVREQREIVVVNNFHDSMETRDFIFFLLEEVIVKAFVSSTDTRVQGFLSFVMQELLKFCEADKHCIAAVRRIDQSGSDVPTYQKWKRLPPSVQDTLTPFLTSKYSIALSTQKSEAEFPIFRPESMRPETMYNKWLKSFVMALLYKPQNANADAMFAPLRRAINIRDDSVANFLLPYLVLHVVLEGEDHPRQSIGEELLSVLQYEIPVNSRIKRDELETCSEAVFRVLDYLSRWIQDKQIVMTKINSRHTKEQHELKVAQGEALIIRVKSVLEMLPAEIISQRAVECKSYARALFYWEQHIREVRETTGDNVTRNMLLERLQDIYTQIDEPDGIEGISAHLHVLDINQQVLGHRKAGRWTAAQSWYEIKLAEDPDNVDVQVNLLTCLKESGQHDVLLNYVEGMHTTTRTVSKLVPFATEASWATGRWSTLQKYTSMIADNMGENFNVSVGRALLALHDRDTSRFTSNVRSLRERIACSISAVTSSSLLASHDTMLKLHVLTELEMLAGTDDPGVDRTNILQSLDRRLEVIGAYLNDKQYILGIRRAAMQLSGLDFSKGDVAAAWLTSARLARKGNAIHQSFNAVLHASQLGDESATIEHARLLWKEGHHRKAIQSLEGAIESKAFASHNREAAQYTVTNQDEQLLQQNLLTARAHLLLAKWMDTAGQTYGQQLRDQYHLACKTHGNWEKGHYYLGRHYNKIMESEKSLPPQEQSEPYLYWETAKLVIESYLRSLQHGTKYIYQTLPRLLTLWLDIGVQALQPLSSIYGNAGDFTKRILTKRAEMLEQVHARMLKYIGKLPAYMFYTALPQIIARIAHPNKETYNCLQNIIIKIVSSFPNQALWCLLAVSTSIQNDRKTRGIQILQRLRNNSQDKKPDIGGVTIKTMISNGEKLAHELLMVCNAGEFSGNKPCHASLKLDLNFHGARCTPSNLAVPVENVLMATLPTLTDNTRAHKAFSQNVVTILSFQDDVLVLSSLQKPRRLTARGSDGRYYNLLCKPKDDLRKDQRLMEFNGMINRSLKRDAESSRRQLYIKTYAVTPLNEECGIIEWVDGLKTLRDILLALYKPLGIAPNYREISIYLEEAIKGPEKLPFFTEKILKQFPPIFHRWFVQQFPEPSAWFAARLRYTRSCAVMSMVGTILGLGDRHGENILFEEGNGGTFHVDFNCLFDKGLTFAAPERVPFRLTHNMVDAMGIYGYEGPFRKSSELTLKLLRQHEETLMTILESFIHDPTLDLVAKEKGGSKKKAKEGKFVVPTTAQGVLDSIRRKVRGLLSGETVPLGVEGQVDTLIQEATNLTFLAGMYIGWCSFF